MFQTQCANCGQPRGFARRLGFGTLFMVLITFGLWLFVIPFYPARCITCGLTRGTAHFTVLPEWAKIALPATVILLVIIVVIGSQKPAPIVQSSDDDKPANSPPVTQTAAAEPMRDQETASSN